MFADTAYEGWLHKEGQKVHSWKHRYFVLNGSVLAYYTDESKKHMKGTVDLFSMCAGIHCLRLLQEEYKDRTFVFYFAVKKSGNGGLKKRDIYLQAEDANSASVWVEKIRQQYSRIWPRGRIAEAVKVNNLEAVKDLLRNQDPKELAKLYTTNDYWDIHFRGECDEFVPLVVEAARLGNVEMVRLLLDAGCNVNSESSDNGGGILKYTALTYATIQKNKEIIDLLMSRGGCVGCSPSYLDELKTHNPDEHELIRKSPSLNKHKKN